jgi:hypothetical protein
MDERRLSLSNGTAFTTRNPEFPIGVGRKAKSESSFCAWRTLSSFRAVVPSSIDALLVALVIASTTKTSR